MLKTILAGTAASVMLAGAAFAQTPGGPSPEDWEPQVRAKFIDEDGTGKSAEDMQLGWKSLSDDDRGVIRASCDAFRAGNENPPGAEMSGKDPDLAEFDMYTFCTAVDAM